MSRATSRVRQMEANDSDDDSTQEETTPPESDSSGAEAEAEGDSEEESEDQDVGPPILALPPGQVAANDGTIWDDRPPTQGRTRTHNFVNVGVTGPRGDALLAQNAIDVFKLFFPVELIQDVVCNWTNRFAQATLAAWNAGHRGEPQKTWKDVDATEIYSFIGILMRSGLSRGFDQPIGEFWSKSPEFGSCFHKSSMSRNRFAEISRYIRFDDAMARAAVADQETLERLAAIQELFIPVNANFGRYYVPNAFLTVDEMMVGFRVNCKFRVYMKNKPARYGIKIWSCADAETRYTLSMQVSKLGNLSTKL